MASIPFDPSTRAIWVAHTIDGTNLRGAISRVRRMIDSFPRPMIDRRSKGGVISLTAHRANVLNDRNERMGSLGLLSWSEFMEARLVDVDAAQTADTRRIALTAVAAVALVWADAIERGDAS